MSNYHISKNRETHRWDIQKEGGKNSSGSADTQKAAEQMAKQFASNSGGGEVRIHDLKGKIRDSDTVAPGNDPRSTKDNRH